MYREVLAFEDSLGDGVQFTVKDDGLRVHCHCDWCGDSESGFGAEVGYDLTLEQAKELYKFLEKWLTVDNMRDGNESIVYNSR